MNAAVDNALLAAAIAKLEADERAREGIDFSLVDLEEAGFKRRESGNNGGRVSAVLQV